MMAIHYFFKLIRWQNLLMLALVQCLIKFSLFIPAFGVTTTLNWYGFLLLVLATVCIAAAGYIINDIYDVEADNINKPQQVIIDKHLSNKAAFNWFLILNILGVLLGFVMAHTVEKSGFFVIFVIVSALLYVYASYLKYTLLFGNIVISLLVSAGILVVGLFDLLPAITPENRTTQLTVFKILLDYAVFAFMLNFIRELIKTIEDIDGDYQAGVNSLPIAIGRERATRIIFGLSLVPVIAVVYYVVTYLYKQPLVVAYFLILVVAPLIYGSIQLFTAEKKAQFTKLSKLYKLIMLLGMLSLLLYKFILS